MRRKPEVWLTPTSQERHLRARGEQEAQGNQDLHHTRGTVGMVEDQYQ
jgi:hypothetical protein